MSSPDYSSDSSSGASSDHSSPSRVCPYRNARFHDQECSRYFDCPSHQLERARSEAAAPDNQNQEERQNVDDEEASHSSRISPSSEDEPARAVLEAGPEAGDASQDVIDLTVSSPNDNQSSPEEPRLAAAPSSANNQSSPEELQFGEAQGSDAERGGTEPLQQGPSPREPVVIDLTADSSDEPAQPGPSSSNQNAERALPTLPQSASGSSISSHRSAGPGSPSFSRRPATPPSPPPASRRRTSSNAFAATRATHPQQRPQESRRPSDLVLPRWQPDAEVTFCPICHTQFSIFIRKHHCR